MEAGQKIIGQDFSIGLMRNCIMNLSKGVGSVVAVSGDSGLGKTFFLSEFSENEIFDESTDCVFVESQPPIGNFKISNLQPLLPFQRMLEKLEELKKSSAKSRLAFDVSMSTLAAIPIGGDIFYMVKEVREAIEKYKKDKKSDDSQKMSIGAEFYYSRIKKHIEKKKLALFIDDLHWCDSQTVELLRILGDEISDLPLMIVFSVNPSILETSASPLLVFMEQFRDNVHFFNCTLESFSLQDIREAARTYLTSYKANKEFEEWLFQKSYGTPGVIIEYLKYFQKNSPFNAEGELIDSFGTEGYLPTTVHSAFSDTLEKLNDEERNLLSVCSAEGREFTALVVSNLMNTDVLTAIKKLRSLQTKTRIIKSIGAKIRYGQTTTVYEFTQAFYHSYFESSLEYEEKVALHGHIAAILKQKYEDAENEAVRQQLAPYLAAHSSASGDDETAKKMLLITAQAAQEYGSTEIMQEAYESYKMLSSKKQKEGDNVSTEDIAFGDLLKQFQMPTIQGIGNGGNGSDNVEAASSFIDFSSLRRILVDEFLGAEYSSVADKSIAYFNARASNLRLVEQAQLLSLAVRAYIEIKDFSSADNYLKKALELPELNKDAIAESFVFNTAAILLNIENKLEDSLNYLRKAAQRAIHLPPEIRLLTLSNIALIQGKMDPSKSKKYHAGIKKLTRFLNFDELDEEIGRIPF